MPLPPKSYFSLEEAASRWGVSVRDVSCYALDGLLEVSVMVFGVVVEVGTIEEHSHGSFRLSEGTELRAGPQPLMREDLWPILRNGQATIGRFKSASPDRYVDVVAPAEEIPVATIDLVVMRTELERFESRHGIAVREEAVAPVEPPAMPQFAPDYSEVVVVGNRLRLGRLQALVIRQLHVATLAETPWINGKQLLAGAGARTVRLRDLFKRQGLWRLLIESDGRGAYRLKRSAADAGVQKQRLYRRLGGRGRVIDLSSERESRQAGARRAT